MGAWQKYKVDVPEGTSGNWKVKRFEVSEKASQISSLRALASGGRGRVRPGTYTQLLRGGAVIMSDTPDEIRDHLLFIRQAVGRVLIHGLGLGMCLNAVLLKDEVTHVTVVEKSADVINLVADHYLGKFGSERLAIIHGDAFEWKPEKGQRWDVVWHDVWGTLCLDNLPQMHTLHRRFGRRSDWQGSWGRDFLERRRREQKRNRWL